MAVIHDFECKFCGTMYEAWTSQTSCGYCGGTGEQIFTKSPVTDIWGGPRFIRSLQRTFDSKSSLNKWLKAHNMTQSPTADKRGGAHLGGAEAYRESRIYFDPRSGHSRDKGTWKRADGER